MDLRQPLCLSAQAPAPPVAGFFDAAQEIFRDELEALGVAVGQPHNAFAVADQFPKPTPIQGGIAPLSGMDLRQIPGQRDGSLSILFPEHPGFGQPFQIEMIAAPLRPLGEDKKFSSQCDRE